MSTLTSKELSPERLMYADEDFDAYFAKPADAQTLVRELVAEIRRLQVTVENQRGDAVSREASVRQARDTPCDVTASALSRSIAMFESSGGGTTPTIKILFRSVEDMDFASDQLRKLKEPELIGNVAT